MFFPFLSFHSHLFCLFLDAANARFDLHLAAAHADAYQALMAQAEVRNMLLDTVRTAASSDAFSAPPLRIIADDIVATYGVGADIIAAALAAYEAGHAD